MSKVYVNKSKHMPAIKDFPIFIQDNLGGKIVIGEELLYIAKDDMGYIITRGGWHGLSDEIKAELPKDHPLQNNKRWEELVKYPELYDIIRIKLKAFFRENFSLVNWEYEEIEEYEENLKKDK